MSSSQVVDLRGLLLAIAKVFEPSGVTGRTRIQKIAYFASKRIKFDVKYSPHYYGPYSDDVSQTLESLTARGLLEADMQRLDTEGPFEGRVYRYKLTEDGRSVLSALRQEEPAAMEQVQKVLQGLIADKPSTQTLAVAAKLDYVVSRQSEAIPQKDLHDRARQFGWRIDPTDIDAGIRYLEKQEFVKVIRA